MYVRTLWKRHAEITQQIAALHGIPRVSLQINKIFRLLVMLISMRASIKTAMDLDLPAPNRPWMQRSSRLVSSAIVTAHSVAKTWPSSSAAKKSAVVLVHWYGSPSTLWLDPPTEVFGRIGRLVGDQERNKSSYSQTTREAQMNATKIRAVLKG